MRTNATIRQYPQFVYFSILILLNSIILAGTARLFRVVGINHWKNSHLFFDTLNVRSNINIFTFERYLATKSGNSKNVDAHPDLYKPSTTKRQTHVPDDLKNHHQPMDTINTNTSSPLAGGGKVW